MPLGPAPHSVIGQVWDTELERTSEEWAETCLWEHGPAGLLPQIGQNLGVHWGRSVQFGPTML